MPAKRPKKMYSKQKYKKWKKVCQSNLSKARFKVKVKLCQSCQKHSLTFLRVRIVCPSKLLPLVSAKRLLKMVDQDFTSLNNAHEI